MKALTLTQPWATLVAIGEKTIETRGWGTSYRGRIAIHAAKGFPPSAQDTYWTEPFIDVLERAGITLGELPLGAIIATADLFVCEKFTGDTAARVRGNTARYPAHEADFGDFTAGRYGFWFRDVAKLAEPIPCRGMLGLWEVPSLSAQMEAVR